MSGSPSSRARPPRTSRRWPAATRTRRALRRTRASSRAQGGARRPSRDGVPRRRRRRTGPAPGGARRRRGRGGRGRGRSVSCRRVARPEKKCVQVAGRNALRRGSRGPRRAAGAAGRVRRVNLTGRADTGHRFQSHEVASGATLFFVVRGANSIRVRLWRARKTQSSQPDGQTVFFAWLPHRLIKR